MDGVLRSLAIYVILLLLFRIGGKRSLAQITTFDLPLRDRMQGLPVDDDDTLTAAREAHGIERLDQIKYAVVERSGGISIVPRPPSPLRP